MQRVKNSQILFIRFGWSPSHNQQHTKQPTAEPIGDITERFVVTFMVVRGQQKHNNQSKEGIFANHCYMSAACV